MASPFELSSTRWLGLDRLLWSRGVDLLVDCRSDRRKSPAWPLSQLHVCALLTRASPRDFFLLTFFFFFFFGLRQFDSEASALAFGPVYGSKRIKCNHDTSVEAIVRYRGKYASTKASRSILWLFRFHQSPRRSAAQFPSEGSTAGIAYRPPSGGRGSDLGGGWHGLARREQHSPFFFTKTLRGRARRQPNATWVVALLTRLGPPKIAPNWRIDTWEFG